MASPTDKPAPAADDLVKRLRKWAKARYAYALADAMLIERTKPNG